MTSHKPEDELEAELRRLFKRVDPVPPEVTEFAKAALGWRRLDADLAELLADSALETEAVALARGAETRRSLSFGGGELAIEVEIGTSDDTHTLLGQLAPAAVATIEVQDGEAAVLASTESDALGRFKLTFAGNGRFRLRIGRSDGAPVETSWFTV